MSHIAGPQDVLDAARAARSALASVVATSEVRGSRQEWADALAELQALDNEVAAAQDDVIVRLAAIEPETLESGEDVETHRAPGHVALDAPAIVSGVLRCSAVHAERRVRAAVRVAADGPADTATATGLGGLHIAMWEGRVDGYRAGVVAHELEEVPAEVAATVVAGLDAFLDREDATRLRRRVRRMLARISPDLLRQRAVRARRECRLERWVDEPGVDTWHGTFPSEDAAQAWAAVDALAQQYVTDGVCPDIGFARAKALTDLVAGNATIDVTVTLVTPIADPAAPDRPVQETVPARPTDLVEVRGLHPGDPVLVERAWLDRTVGTSAQATSTRYACHRVTGALLDPDDDLATDAYRPGTRLAALVRARDGRCRFPGCHVAARFCDLDHIRPWPSGPTRAAALACLCRRHHRVKQRPEWTVVLRADGSMTWTDPTGRTRTTLPVDHRHGTVLPDLGGDEARVVHRPRRAFPDGPHSALEHALEHRLARVPGHAGRARTTVELQAAHGAVGEWGTRCRTQVAGRRRHRPDDPPY